MTRLTARRRARSAAASSAGTVRPRTPLWRRVLRVLAAGLVVIVLIAVGSWAWATRAQGQPQAVEFSGAELGPAMTDAKVLALGEATHGNHEYQELRTSVLAKLVDQGFRTVVLEEDVGQTHEVNEFVQGGPGTAAEAAKRFGFAINKTQEVAAWLQWMRDHNASVPPEQRVRLVGMDVQRTEASLRIVATALRESNPQLAARAMTEGEDVSADTLAALTTALAEVPQDRRGDAEVSLTALKQRLEVRQGSDAGLRDRVMFTNLRRIVRGTGGGVMLVAHDAHVAKTPTGALPETVGHQAAAEWGEKYRVIGTDFHRTRFLSGTKEDRREWSLTNRTPLRGMYAGTQVGYLEIGRTTGENRALFDAVQPMGSAGESFTWLSKLLPFSHTVYVAPSQAYDAVILVEDATPVTML